jgi:hypothetical protein
MLQDFIKYYTLIIASCHLMIVLIVMNGKPDNVGGDEELLDFIQKRNIKTFCIMLPIYAGGVLGWLV